MAESRHDLVQETEALDRAIKRKWNRFTWSGLLILGVGLVVIAIGVALNTGAYLIIGLGAIIVIVGIVRILIGLINPLAPADLRNVSPTIEEATTADEDGTAAS